MEFFIFLQVSPFKMIYRIIIFIKVILYISTIFAGIIIRTLRYDQLATTSVAKDYYAICVADEVTIVRHCARA